jgi:hypothetical protein
VSERIEMTSLRMTFMMRGRRIVVTRKQGGDGSRSLRKQQNPRNLLPLLVVVILVVGMSQ